MKTFCIIDAGGLLHRAYYHLKDVEDERERSCRAVGVFLRLLERAREMEKPPMTRAVVVFDSPIRPYWRTLTYPPYKAQRPQKDAFDVYTKAVAPDAAIAAGWTVLSAPGQEADDIVVTAAHRALKAGYEVTVFTSDKDMLCLLALPGVKMVTLRTFGEIKVSDVKASFGIPPKALPDYLAIVGDSSDNLPGLNGVGPVKAAKMLAAHGWSLEAAIEAGDPLVAGREAEARAWARLTTPDENAPIALDPDGCRLRRPDREALEALGRERLRGHSLCEALDWR